MDADPAAQEQLVQCRENIQNEKEQQALVKSVENLADLVESPDNEGGGAPGKYAEITDPEDPGGPELHTEGGSRAAVGGGQECGALEKFVGGSDAEGSPSRYIEDNDQDDVPGQYAERVPSGACGGAAAAQEGATGWTLDAPRSYLDERLERAGSLSERPRSSS